MSSNKKRHYIFIFFIFSFSIVSLLFLTKGLDYYWHYKAGEVMWSTKKILTYDIFSFLSQGKHLYWMSHEWLQEIILFFFSKISTNYHILIYCFTFFFLLLLTLYKTNEKEYHKNLPFSLFYIGFSIIVGANFIMPRPMMISNILFVITLYLLFDFYRNEENKKVWFLPLVSLIWANIHGSSNLPYLLAILFGIISICSFSYGKIECSKKTRKQIVTFFIIALISFIALAINPHGIKMWYYPYQNMGNTMMLKNIQEWQPTVVSNLSHMRFFFYLFFLVFVILKSPKKIQGIDFILILIFTYLGLKSIRFWGYLYLASNFFIFDYVKKMPSQKQTNYFLLVLGCILIIFFCVLFPKVKEKVLETPLSDKMISIIKKQNPKRLYNDYDYGGYLIYHDIPVFVDGRADFYSDIDTYKDYIYIGSTDNRYKFEKLLEKYQFDFFLTPKNRRIYYYLKEHKYPIVYEEKNGVLFRAKDVK